MKSLILLSKERGILYPLRHLEVSSKISSVRHFLSYFLEGHRSQLKRSSFLIYNIFKTKCESHPLRLQRFARFARGAPFSFLTGL